MRGIMPDTAMAIANEFLRKPGALGRLTQMQLLKLTYIAHGWNLAVNGEPLVPERVEAWNYGPVIPDLYNHIRFNGNDPITREIADSDSSVYFFYGEKPAHPKFLKAILSPQEKEVIDKVWNRYGKYSGFQLSQLTHKQGTPWFETYFGPQIKNKIIPNDLIRKHYIELAHRVA